MHTELKYSTRYQLHQSLSIALKKNPLILEYVETKQYHCNFFFQSKKVNSTSFDQKMKTEMMIQDLEATRDRAVSYDNNIIKYDKIINFLNIFINIAQKDKTKNGPYVMLGLLYVQEVLNHLI